MRDFLIGLLLAALFFAGGFLTRHLCHFSGDSTDVKVKVDTLYRTDTIRLYEPKIVEKRVVDTMVVESVDYIVVHDTAYVSLPREEVVYRDTSYRAVVSGYLPRLEELEIYQRERVVTVQTEKVVRVPEARRWGVGVQAGYGVTPAGMQPYLGVGVSFNLLRF